MQNDKWTKKITEWTGPLGKRNRGRRKERWNDEISNCAGKNWMTTVKDREIRRKMEEAFTR